MASIYGRFEFEDDSLTPGHADGGGLSQLLFDSEGRLADHATFFPDEGNRDPAEGDSDPDAYDADAAALLVLAVLAAGAAIAVGGYVAVRKVAPQVQRLVNERALPAVKSFWNRVQGPRNKEMGPEAGNEADGVAEVPRLILDDEVSVGMEVELSAPRMSAEEWYARFRTMLSAQAVADEQWRALSSVRVVRDQAIPELQAEMTQHSLSDVLERARHVIEAATEEHESDSESGDSSVEVRRPITLATEGF